MSEGYPVTNTDILRKSVSVFAAVMLLLAVLFSAFFISEELHHDCTGEDCPICRTISLCETLLNRAFSGTAVMAVSFLAVITVMFDCLLPGIPDITDTLVSNKVRLDT